MALKKVNKEKIQAVGNSKGDEDHLHEDSFIEPIKVL